MTTINGKLVDLNLLNLDEDSLKKIEQIEISEETELENIRQWISVLENRLHQLENQSNYLEKICQKLERLEKQTSQKIMAITIIGAMGLTSLGIWAGLSYRASVSAKNNLSFPTTYEVDNR